MKIRPIVQALLGVAMVLYPFGVWWAIKNGQLLWVSGLLIMVAITRFALKPNSLFAPLTVVALVCGGLGAIRQDELWLKFYPVLMSLGTLAVFAWTLKFPPSMIERFARLHEPDLPESGVRWTRKVTQIWCGFFVINALFAFLTVVIGNDTWWALYNGFISYVFMGVLLLGEFILRKRQQKLNNHHE